MSKNISEWYSRLLDNIKDTDEYLEEGAVIEFTEEMLRQMEIAGISRAELARRLGVNAAYITKILRGDYNYTLKNMARVAHALGTEFKIRFQPYGTKKTARKKAATVKKKIRRKSTRKKITAKKK